MNNAITVTDRFSWRRVAMLFRYWFPRFDYHIWIFPLIVLVCGLLSLCFNLRNLSPVGVGVLTLSYYAIVLGPLVFAGRRAPEIRATLPVKTSEQFVFLIIVSMVIIPGVVYGLTMLFATLSGVDITNQTILNKVAAEGDFIFNNIDFTLMAAFSGLTYLTFISICLWGVFSAKNSPVGKSLLSVVLAYIITSFTWGILGVVTAIYKIESGMSDDETIEAVKQLISIGMYVMTPVMAVIMAIFLRLTWRALAHKQI